MWLSHRDAAQFFGPALETDRPYGIYYATSDNKWKTWDNRRARAELGYAPEDGAGDG